MRKIGFVIPWFGENIPGGAEMELREVTAHLQKAGMEVEILTSLCQGVHRRLERELLRRRDGSGRGYYSPPFPGAPA